MMKKFFLITGLLALAAFKANQTEAYVFITLNGGTQVKWNLGVNAGIVQNGRVTWNLNPAGSDNVAFPEVERAITNAFNAWEDVANSKIAFARGANSTRRHAQTDGQFQVYWVENSSDTDYGNLAGAIGVTYLTYRTNGELLDSSLLLNGVDTCWATDGRGNCADITEVATHEIGHAIGLEHSPVGDATMFPRTGQGSTRSRSLASDDMIAASVLYPVSDLATRTGSLAGTVRDTNGAAIFGANVVASDRDGNVIATALSQPDGSYRITGLPPGEYSVFAEPIDSLGGVTFYGLADLNSFYDSAVLNFLTTNDQPASLRASNETTLNFTVTRGTPPFNPSLVFVAGSQGSLLNIGTTATAGTSTTVGLGGVGLPSSGTPLSLSGTGITVTRTRFGTFSGSSSGQVILLDISIAANAIPGGRTLFVTNGTQRAAIAGAVEIIGNGAPPPVLSVVSAANYAPTVAQESIASVFGGNLAGVMQTARTNPLPTNLGGVTITVRDNAGNERPAPLFFVSPAQINYQLPPNTPPGSIAVNFFNNGAPTGRSSLNLERIAPGLFAVNGTGRGPSAGLVLRINANNQQTYEPLASFNGSQWQTVAADWSNSSDRLFLVLFGTGLRFRSSLAAVTAAVGGRGQNVTYAGAQGTLIGVDQINIQLNRADVIGRGELDVTVTAEGKPSNTVRVNFK